MRIDKWLWSARFYKSRGLAQAAVDGGKVKVNGERCKPAREIRTGDRVEIGIGEYVWDVTVRALSLQRGPAEDARELYEEDEDSLARRAQAIEAKKLSAMARPEREAGAPNKHDRRQLRRFRGR